MKNQSNPPENAAQQFSSIKFWHYPIDPYHYPIDPSTGGYGGTSIDALLEYAGRSRAPLLRDAIQSSLTRTELDISKAKFHNPSKRATPEQRLSATGPAIIAELLIDEIRNAIVSPSASVFSEAAGTCELFKNLFAEKDLDKIREEIYGNAKAEASEVAARRDHRKKEQLNEILAQASDLPVFFAAAVGLQAAKHANTLMLLQLALRATNIIVFQIKHMISCPRPAEFIPAIAPVVLTPSHGSFPSGHATQAFSMAYILSALRGDAQPAQDKVNSLSGLKDACKDSALYKLAEDVADNRVAAGVHYPMDSVAGFFFGRWFGASIEKAGKDKSARATASGVDRILPHLWNSAVAEWS
jgi:PAP2 superfamily